MYLSPMVKKHFIPDYRAFIEMLILVNPQTYVHQFSRNSFIADLRIHIHMYIYTYNIGRERGREKLGRTVRAVMSGIVIAHENNGSALSLVSARIHYGSRSHSVIHDVVKAVRGITVTNTSANDCRRDRRNL